MHPPFETLSHPQTLSTLLSLRDVHSTSFNFCTPISTKAMVRSHERSPSPTGSSDSLLKRLKTTHSTNPDAGGGPLAQFADGVLDPDNSQELRTTYMANEPFKYCVLDKLFQDHLLENVKDECLKELSFTEKETDIYKVRQTGDLVSLSYLSPDLLCLLPSLLTLRDALYSSTFRNFLRSVTNCGPLSGTKQDMSVNSYTKGCHLLNHDDVIGTRRVSYILYMPLPHTSQWKEEWGGALELYPTKLGKDGIPEPVAIPCKKIPPSWNQFVFFEVQPGKSFHSVEEVVVGGKGDVEGRERLSISGWFHAPQEGEDGYEPEGPVTQVKSSREQLTSTSTVFKSYPDTQNPPMPDTPLTEDHISFLSEFLNPVYLQPRTMKALAARFVEESSLELHSFLCGPLADKLENGLREVDTSDGLNKSRNGRIPSHDAGTSSGAWTIKTPPHKWRYCVLKPHIYGPPEEFSPQVPQAASDEVIRSLQDELFTSNAFRAWLSVVSRLLPLRYTVEGRRFRPGLDYTLATSEEQEARLDVVLDLTPDIANSSNGDGRVSNREDGVRGWQIGEWGGWECYMAPHDEEDDPAVYRSGSHKKQPPNGKQNSKPSNADCEPPGEEDEDMEDVENEEDEEDATLLTVQPGFNRLLLVLRDEGVMRFVKYVSAAAESSRWDVCGEYEVGMVQEANDE